MRLDQVYDEDFYAQQVAGSARSAAVMVPLILRLFPQVKSVVDLGCGTGTWLQRFKIQGVDRVLGLDAGDPQDNLREIDASCVRRADLTKRIDVSERFDLCMTIEVAEHLPAKRAPGFVANACALSDVVVFGAAVPGQGGHNHVNERWPSYWTTMFAENGYTCIDALRPFVWYDTRVEWWYAQNTFVFVRESRGDLISELHRKITDAATPMDLVHPRCFEAFRRSLDLANRRTARAPKTSSEASPSATNDAWARVAELEAEVQALRTSLSWRITGPVRRVAASFPGIVQRLQKHTRDR